MTPLIAGQPAVQALANALSHGVTAMPAYTVTIYERDNPARKAIALLGDAVPQPAGGGGGYVTVTLPKRKAITVWQGIGQGNGQPLTMTLPIVVGGAGNGAAPSVDGPVKQLIDMWRPADSTDDPPVLKVRCPGDVIPYQHVPWVLDDFQWGAAVADFYGHKTMQALTLTLMEFVADERLQTARVKHHHRHRKHRTYRVRKGDTLTSIAAHFKVKGGWRALGQAQHPPINDPRKIHVHQVLLIP